MSQEKFDETDDGYYVQHGDVREWVWKAGKGPGGPAPVTTADVEPVVAPARKRTTRKKAKK